MRHIACIAGLLLLPVPALAQPASTSGAETRPHGQPETPLPGANSFVESQARAAIVAKGYVDVSPLMNDRQGIWRGTARKGDQTFNVSVDYMGHVDAK